ncbi:hypothetical protein AcV7_003927 [Taiwanofungus camphoratus]|nr:hypothetical protein AcV7_003927 [Antrodia cinnamomea]
MLAEREGAARAGLTYIREWQQDSLSAESRGTSARHEKISAAVFLLRSHGLGTAANLGLSPAMSPRASTRRSIAVFLSDASRPITQRRAGLDPVRTRRLARALISPGKTASATSHGLGQKDRERIYHVRIHSSPDVDPTLEQDLASPLTPWALSPLITTMPYLEHTRLEAGAQAPPFPPQTPVGNKTPGLRFAA